MGVSWGQWWCSVVQCMGREKARTQKHKRGDQENEAEQGHLDAHIHLVEQQLHEPVARELLEWQWQHQEKQREERGVCQEVHIAAVHNGSVSVSVSVLRGSAASN